MSGFKICASKIVKSMAVRRLILLALAVVSAAREGEFQYAGQCDVPGELCIITRSDDPLPTPQISKTTSLAFLALGDWGCRPLPAPTPNPLDPHTPLPLKTSHLQTLKPPTPQHHSYSNPQPLNSLPVELVTPSPPSTSISSRTNLSTPQQGWA